MRGVVLGEPRGNDAGEATAERRRQRLVRLHTHLVAMDKAQLLRRKDELTAAIDREREHAEVANRPKPGLLSSSSEYRGVSEHADDFTRDLESQPLTTSSQLAGVPTTQICGPDHSTLNRVADPPPRKRGKWDSDSESDDEKKPPAAAAVSHAQAAGKSMTTTLAEKPLDSEPELAPINTGSSGSAGVAVWAEARSVDVYDKTRSIGEGQYGVVWEARSPGGGTVALKQIKISMETGSMQGFPVSALREINILSELSHRNILKLHEVVVGARTDQIFLAMECVGTDVCTILAAAPDAFTPSDAKCLLHQLLSALAYMHERRFMHRDIKPANMLYDGSGRSGKHGRLVICDFGMARAYDSPARTYTLPVVTLYYRPPELLLGCQSYGPAVDAWSAGCCLGELLQGQVFLQGQGEIAQLKSIFRMLGCPSPEAWQERETYPMSSNISWDSMPKQSRLREVFPPFSMSGGPYLSDAGIDLLSGLLCFSPSQRLMPSDALKSSYFIEAPAPTPMELMPRLNDTIE